MVGWKRILLSSIAANLDDAVDTSIYFGPVLVRLTVDCLHADESTARAMELPETVGAELAWRINHDDSLSKVRRPVRDISTRP